MQSIDLISNCSLHHSVRIVIFQGGNFSSLDLNVLEKLSILSALVEGFQVDAEKRIYSYFFTQRQITESNVIVFLSI